jgi:hypothetical protein
MNAKLVNGVRIWGTGLAMMWQATLGLGIVFAPAYGILWSLRAVHVSLDVTLWVTLAYLFLGAPFVTYYLGRLFGIRVRKMLVSNSTQV